MAISLAARRWKKLAASLKKPCEQEMLPSRFGGEEFAAFLLDANYAQRPGCRRARPRCHGTTPISDHSSGSS